MSEPLAPASERTDRAGRVFLGITALLWLGLGLWLLISPEALFGFVGLRAADPSGLVEIRAFYGGLELSLGVILAVPALRGEQVRPAIFVATATLLGLGLGRVIGIILEPSTLGVHAPFAASEWGGATWGAALLLRRSRPEG